jgi:hypothetical protein
MDPVWLGTEPPVMAGKLNMASWRTWPSEQQTAVVRFFVTAFRATMETHPDGGRPADEWLCGIATLGESVSPAFERWRSSASPNAALQMASFISREAKHLRRHAQVAGSFWKGVNEEVRREVAKLLTAERTRAFLDAAAARESEESYLIGAALSDLQRQF